ncbi:MAG TPA: hypothetical protein VHL58_05175 [Thermoanaerobaculia bacterium]|nr:hypothetical protein [Thermoanaerobaculia bacterium]
MSRINGEKARAAVHRKRSVVQRSKARALRAEHIEKVKASAPAGPAPAPKQEAASVAPVKAKKTGSKASPESVIESLKPKGRAKAAPAKTEE